MLIRLGANAQIGLVILAPCVQFALLRYGAKMLQTGSDRSNADGGIEDGFAKEILVKWGGHFQLAYIRAHAQHSKAPDECSAVLC